jgi:hypothetical protein
MSNSHIPSYPKVFSLGHPAITDLLSGLVVVQEKYDGSQFSFMVEPVEPTPEDPLAQNGRLIMRSRGAEVFAETADKLFKPAVETVLQLFKAGKLVHGWIYRCECISKPRHNTLSYHRVPLGYLVLFDIETSPNLFLDHDEVDSIAFTLGLDSALCLYDGLGSDVDLPYFKRMLERMSTLGGCLIEGITIKRYDAWGRDGKVLMGKFVSEAFKETHSKAWASSNPGGKDILGQIAEHFRTPARWAKALQHLKESGSLQSAPQDIGPCMKLLSEDVSLECKEEAMAMWWDWARGHVIRGVQRGFAEFYKEQLAKKQFESNSAPAMLDVDKSKD